MNAGIANNIYVKSNLLKKYAPGDLLWKSKRSALTKEVDEIFKLCCELLKELQGDDEYSDDYIKLITMMLDSLFQCVVLLAVKGKNYRLKVWGYVHGFHNLSRAFLDEGNTEKISVETEVNPKYWTEKS